MTLSETQIDKFCQSRFRLNLPSDHPPEATTPILGTLTAAFLASVSALKFIAETPGAPRKIRANGTDWNASAQIVEFCFSF
jgi:hypothetical protein